MSVSFGKQHKRGSLTLNPLSTRPSCRITCPRTHKVTFWAISLHSTTLLPCANASGIYIAASTTTSHSLASDSGETLARSEERNEHCRI